MTVEDTYRTVEGSSSGVYREKGSKFIAIARPVQHEDEARAVVEELRKEYYDARHHCYAYVLGAKGERWRANDDGEPSGTAGKPIHGQLLSFDLTNVLLVVVRYFGGTRLGVSGLINAYRSAAHDALRNARIITKTVDDIFRISFGYLATNDIMRIIKDLDIAVGEQQFGNSCAVTVSIRKSLSNALVSRVEKVESASLEHISTA